MDSNFRFRVRCKRGLRRKSPASAACRRRLSGAAGSVRDEGSVPRFRFAPWLMATDGGPPPSWPRPAGQGFGSFNRKTTRASRHAPRAGPALGTTLRGASPPSSPSRFRTLNGSSCPIPVIGRRGSGGLKRGAAIIRDEGERPHSPGQCQPVARFHSSGSPALPSASNQGCRMGLHPVNHLTLRLGVETASFGQSAVASDPEEDRSLCHPLGAPQVQAVASEAQGGTRLV